MTERPDLEDIVTALQREFDDAEDFYAQVLQPEQEAANKYYDAEPFGDEIEGKSQIVLPDVAEAIDYMSASILRVFLSSDRVVEIEATEEADEMGAEEATAALHYNFMREQDGARILGDWLQSGLLERIGVIKTVCESEERVTRAKVQIDEMQAVALQAGMLVLDEGQEVEDIEPNEDGTFSATLKRTRIVKRYVDVTIPLDEFRFARNARHEDSSDYLAHVSLKTRSELVEMGFDRDQVADLPLSDNLGVNAFQYSRNTDYERDTNGLPSELQQVLLCEEYARMDVDGDGIAERVKVFRVGDQILIDAETGEPSIETISEQPIVVWSPLPRAHRLVGNSLADKVMDIQRIRSVIARQMQDAMYLANMPRPLVDMTSDYAATTLEDVLRPIAGSPIRYKGQPPAPFQAGLDVSKSLTVLEHWNGERETRTGITRLNQGLDADTLNKTATGAALMASQGQQMEEAIARQFGEAFGRLMAKKLRLMRAEGARFPVKIDGSYTEADASRWPEDFKTIIRVGLGTGRKEQRLQYLFAMAPLMQQAFEVGVADKAGLFRYGSEVVSAMQLGQGDDYFVNPADQPEEQEQPDPAMMEAQAKAQTEQMKAQVKAQGDQLSAQSKAQAAQMTAMFKLQGDRERMAQEAELRREELDREERLRLIEIAADAEAKANLRDATPGGDLSR